jgi:hypothetical protein
MHFNDLIMRLRVQALGGLAAVGAIVVVLIKELPTQHERWLALALLFVVLSVLWLAIGIIDFFYYNRLLIGAVQALLAIEESTRAGQVPVGLSLSTTIRRAVEEPDKRWRKSIRAPLAFYVAVLAVLVFMLALSTYNATSSVRGTTTAAATLDRTG